MGLKHHYIIIIIIVIIIIIIIILLTVINILESTEKYQTSFLSSSFSSTVLP